MNIRYILGAIITIPLLPLMYFQGRRVKSTIPDLPEAVGTEGCSGSKSTQAFKLLVLGESTMAGVGVDTHREGFVGTIAEEIARLFHVEVTWKVHAKSGLTAARLTHELIPEIKDANWDLIVVGLGGNDAFQLNSLRRWKKDIRIVIAELKSKFDNAPIVFANMPPIKEFPAFTPLMKFTVGNLVEILGKSLEETVSNCDAVYYSSEVITIEKWTKQLNIEPDISAFFSDGVHPSKLTYQTLAKQVAGFIKENVIFEV